MYNISKKKFLKLKELNYFDSKVAYNKIRKNLYLKSKIKVKEYENRNIFAKWWNNYYELKDLTSNYTYLDIDVVFQETMEDVLKRQLKGMVMYNLKREGLL